MMDEYYTPRAHRSLDHLDPASAPEQVLPSAGRGRQYGSGEVQEESGDARHPPASHPEWPAKSIGVS
jgi:hypothetical protein